MAQLVELNRERMQTIEQQIRQLEAIRMEQIQAIEALRAIPDEGTEGAMIPLGSGLQIIADIPVGIEHAQMFHQWVGWMDRRQSGFLLRLGLCPLSDYRTSDHLAG